MKKKSKNIKQKIFDEYSKLALEGNGQLKSVYLFCKKTNIKQTEFYEHFGSLNHVRDQIFCQFYENTYKLPVYVKLILTIDCVNKTFLIS